MSVGFVAIGRNEGQRLHACLRACLTHAATPGHVVYVDSGSTDGSVAFAEALGITVVALDMDRPFTAARARNAGWRRLLEVLPDTAYVQFLDGDCELRDGWIDTARAALDADPKLAVVCGRNRERFPERSPYNRLCDLEWDTPIGPALYCGGNALMRVSALDAAGGYDDTLIAGEEPELCVRLRMAGWTLERLDAEMSWHDANITRFTQFWKRAKRAGHAYAEGHAMHGGPPMHHWDREVRSIRFWGMTLPTIGPISVALSAGLWIAFGFELSGALLAAATAFTIVSVGLLWAYGALAIKVFWRQLQRGEDIGQAQLYAASIVVAKFAQASGLRMYRRNQRRGRKAGLIEYKDAANEA